MIYFHIMDEQLEKTGFTIHLAQRDFMESDFEIITNYYAERVQIMTITLNAGSGQIIVKHQRRSI